MSIINKFNKSIQMQDLKTLGQKVESEDFIRNFLDNEQEYLPPIDYSNPENFARMGLAEQYYDDSVKRIYRTYPYDGSLSEKQQWAKESTNLDKWLLDNLYPRTNGYITIGDNWDAQVIELSGYGAPQTSSYEYIQFKGGPNVGFDLTGDRKSKKISNRFENANIYDSTKKRQSNLESKVDSGMFSGSDNGVTVEFWLKKNGFSTSYTSKEVIFDLWNGKDYTNDGYGRITIEMNATASNSPFRITYMSGTNGFSYHELGSSQNTVATVGNNTWKHYAFSFYNNDSDTFECSLHVNGKLDDQLDLGTSPPNQITGSLIANIGALRTNPSGTSGILEGYGKLLSSSLDEFRFWKVKRTSEEIGKYWNIPVGGGSNYDDNTTKLGIYYKFNEGITQTSSVDNVVLDYSGRVSNGSWTGYTQALTPRHTGSAIVESTSSLTEFKDPIVYSFHPDVSTLHTNLINSGSEYDLERNTALFYTMPKWIIEEDATIGDGELKKLCQIIGNTLDNIFIQTQNLTKFQNIQYISDKNKQNPIIKKLLKDLDFNAPDIFSNSSVFEYFIGKNDSGSYEKNIHEVKNTIYQNVYNNLIHINKSKGNERSFRNLLRCFGVDRDLIKYNLYSDLQTYELKDNFEFSSKNKNLLNFYKSDHFESTVYQMTASGDSNTRSYILGEDSGFSTKYIPFTIESEIIFPKRIEQTQHSYIPVLFNSSSLFGCHNSLSTNGADLTWQLPETSSVQLYAVRDRNESQDVKFVLTGTVGGSFPVLTSSYYPNVYNDDKWNFGVSVRPKNYPRTNLVNSSSDEYILELYGVNTVLDVVPTIGTQKKEVYLTASLTNQQGINFLTSDKRIYGGAHRTNFTGSTLTKTDIQLSTIRAWRNYIPTSSIYSHAKYNENKSIKSLYSNLGTLNNEIQNIFVPNVDTLLLEWNFTQNTGSNDLGQFYVYDEASGSTDLSSRYGQLSEHFKYQYPGRGDYFSTSSLTPIVRKYIPTTILKSPEIVNSSDMVEIRDTNVEVFTKDSRPVKHIHMFEKNMYQNISEDMLKWFETISEYGNLFGQPVEKYRDSYKSLEKLRHLYFQNIDNEPDFEKFLNFYKWFDNSILEMLHNLLPASAPVPDNSLDVLESHIFERNKIVHKFPLLETKVATSGNITSPSRYDWKYRHAPTPLNEEVNGKWWRDLASRDTSTDIWDINSNIINIRKSFADIKSTTQRREEKQPFTHDLEKSKIIHGGINFEKEKVLNKPKKVDDVINIYGGDIEALRGEYNDALKDGNVHPLKRSEKFAKFKTFTGHQTELSGSGKLFAPFNIVSSSTDNKYKQIVNKNVEIVNLHHDVYNNEHPIQGIFTDQHVGGHYYRHVPLNTGSDVYLTRPEGFRIVFSGVDTEIYNGIYNNVEGLLDYSLPNNNLSRNVLTKRPLNVQNILSTTSSNVLGNYIQNYEVVNSTGRKENNIFLRENAGVSASYTGSVKVIGLYDFSTPRRDLTGSKSIIASRFSSPGGPETSAEGYLDLESSEYSVYNALPWRNLTVRNSLLQLLSTSSYQFGVDNPANPLSASYHKNNKNYLYRLENNGSSIVTSSLDDNAIITHMIPRSDLNYRWIKDSAVEVNNIHISNQNVPFGYSTGSLHDNKHRSITFLSSSDFGSYVNVVSNARFFGADETVVSNQFLFTDFVGINSNIYEPITVSSNLLGYSSHTVTNLTGDLDEVETNYVNNSIVGGVSGEDTVQLATANGTAGLLNSLNLKRNGPYGFSSWKMIRVNEHPIARYYRNNNIISISVQPTPIDFENSTFTPKKPYKFINFIEGPVSDKCFPLKTRLEYSGSEITIKHTYGTKFQKYSDSLLNNMLEFSGENKTKYDNIANIYFNNSENKFIKLIYKENIWPSQKFVGLNKIRQRTNYAESGGYGANGIDRRIDLRTTYWPINLQRTDITGSTPFQNSVNYRWGRSVYPFGNKYIWYAQQETTPPTAHHDLVNGKLITGSESGELSISMAETNNVPFVDANIIGLHGYGQRFVSGNVSDSIPANYYVHPTASLQYVYLPFLGKFTEYSWPYDVAKQAGKEPFYKDYNSFAHDLKPHSQNMSIVPEFRISDTIDYFLENNENIFLENKKFLTLEGALYSASADNVTSSQYVEDFFKTYTNSDVLNFYNKVYDDHKDIAKLKNIKITCKGVKKLLPYNGFYPINRTTQLGAIFSQSLGPYVSGNNGQYLSREIQTSGAYALQALLQPFFAPGILYNTIKSGIAVDWPYFTGSTLQTDVRDAWVAQKYGGSGDDPLTFSAHSLCMSASGFEQGFNTVDDFREYMITSSFDAQPSSPGNPSPGKFHGRMPFETLVDLDKGLLKNTNILFMAPDKVLQSSGSSGSIYPYFHWNGQKNPQYELAMHNFLSEIPKFFLEDEKLTTFISTPEKSFKPMKKGKTYYMDVVLHKTNDMYMMKSYFSGNVVSGATGQFDTPLTYHGRYFGPPSNKGAIPAYANFEGNIFDTRAWNYADPAYAPYTPPYFYAESYYRLSFNPSETRKYTIDEIITNVISSGSKNILRDVLPGENTFFAQNNAMQIDASVNLFGKTNTLNTADASGFDSWEISTKFETPVLNFSGSNPSSDQSDVITVPADSQEGFLGRGMWGTYGQIPTGSTGIYLSLRESYPEVNSSNITSSNTTGSLIEICGFKPEQKRIGRIANQKRIEEAIVVIPYVEREIENGVKIGGRNFIKINKQDYNNIKIKLKNNENIPDTSIKHLIKTMDKYYFPPFMDFSTNKNIDPFVAYIFEFHDTLDKQDLSDIWQGVMPKLSTTVKKQDITYNHPISHGEFFSDVDLYPDMRWLVFKLKRKAGKNYYDLFSSERQSDEFINKNQLNYNYNWPYDFFSLVELAKIDVELTLGSKK